MIDSLQGIVRRLGEGELVLEVGGVGLRVAVPSSVLEQAPAPGEPFFLHTHLVVREDSLTLYGFTSPEQRELFRLLMAVDGVGPRLALAALSHLSGDMIRNAVAHEQPEVLARVPGIGRKTAEKIVFHLRDRLQPAEVALRAPSPVDTEVVSVLTALGYSLVEAQAAVQSLPEDAPEDVEARVKLALRYFARP